MTPEELEWEIFDAQAHQPDHRVHGAAEAKLAELTRLTDIRRQGQRSAKEEVFSIVRPRKDLTTPIAQSIAAVFSDTVKPLKIILRTEKVRLRWMKPDSNGGLVPK